MGLDSKAAVRSYDQWHAIGKTPDINLPYILDSRVSMRPNMDETHYSFWLAMDVLFFFLGDDWSNACLDRQREKVDKKYRDARRFLRIREGKLRRTERMVRLADLLFNLRFDPELGARLVSMRNGDFESTYAEFEFASHFIRRNIPVNFVATSNVKGSDFDFTAGVGKPVCCEVKCRIEDCEFQGNTFLNALKKARTQVPSNRLSIVGVKIPESWVREISDVFLCLSDSLDRFFRDTKRIVAVAIRWEENYEGETSGYVKYRFRFVRNPYIEMIPDEVGAVLQNLSKPSMPLPDWLSLRMFVANHLALRRILNLGQ